MGRLSHVLMVVGTASALTMIGATFIAPLAHAQSAPPYDPSIDVQTFDYAIGPKTFFTVADGDIAAPKQLAMDAMVTFLTKPFQIYNVRAAGSDDVTGTRTTVIESMTAAQLTAAYGLTDKLQLGANLPIVFSLQGDGLMPSTGTAQPGGLNVTGLGDLLVEGKYRLLRRGPIRLAALGGITLPTSVGSGGSAFIGDDLPSVRAKFAGQYDAGRWSVGGNVGVAFRDPRKIYGTTIGQQLTWGVAGAARITDRIALVAEGYGRAGLPSFSTDASPLEVEGGVRVYATSTVSVVAGGGAGVVNGIGSPEARFFLSLGYAPDVRDSDGDGIPNGRDKCPVQAEDKDGSQDDDGCPDDDNDGDHRPDALDKCPNVAEDLDGFEDDDGCPDLDNDKDGIADLQDKCPNLPEDGKGEYPKDGCPEGKTSEIRTAPVEPEPAPTAAPDAPPVACVIADSDRDGIPDAQDQCVNEAETINGVSDDDGCPDTGGLAVAHLDGDRLAIDRVPTVDKKGLTRGGEIIVDQMAQSMRGQTDVTEWVLAIAQPKEADAKKLGAAITARLVAKGVAADRIQVLTTKGAAKIGGYAKQRTAEPPPVCK